jgi:dipeptidyl aminopeptidase/acylaminoacyl peptidase
VIATLCLVLAAPVSLQDTHAFGVQDMLAMDRIADARVSPDGKRVLFTLSATDLEANRRRTDLWIADVDGGKPRALTTHPAADFNGRWMPDGKSIVFLSTRGGGAQVWQLAVDGGEAQQLTRFELDVGNLEVFPGGKRLLLSFEVWPDAKTLAESVEKDAAAAKRKGSGKAYESLPIRHWDTWEDGKRSHVFTWKLEGGAPVDLLAGLDCDAPTKPFGGFEETSISPDGSTVALVFKNAGREFAWSTNSDVHLVPADGSAPPRNVSNEGLGYDTHPCFSPSGTQLAYLSMPRAGYEADRQQIVLMDVASGAKRMLAQGWDRSASDLVWSADEKTIFTSAANLGNTSLFSIDVASGDVRTLIERGANSGPLVAGARIVFSRNHLKSPTELYSMNPDGSDLKAVTALNAAKVAAARMGDYEQFSFAGAKGDKVYGFVMKPADFETGKKYPVAFLIHGGPQGSFGDSFHYRWNPQAYAGAGFGVVFIDFHGSTGYGQAFTDAINQDWGGAPYEDLMKGLDYALANYPFLDGGRAAALGASYGGYMINWIAGQAPERFKALVNHDGNLDERLAYFDTEELWFPEWDHGGLPWTNPQGYAKHNPIEHVHKWKTPMLVIHGALDYRVVDTQGMSTFTALQRQGIPSKFLYFPDENHWILKPQNTVQWHDNVLEWIARWTR